MLKKENMSYVCVIKHKSMRKTEQFTFQEQELAVLSRVLSHPARLAILKFLAETECCISGDISNEIPLSRTTVSQHLSELKNAGLIKGEIEGVKVSYCLDHAKISNVAEQFNEFFSSILNHKKPSCTL